MNPGKFKELYDERLNPDCNLLFPKPKANCDAWKLNEPKTSPGGEIYYEEEKITVDAVAEMMPKVRKFFLNFSFMFLYQNIFSNLLDMRNLQEQVKKAFCHKKLF